MWGKILTANQVLTDSLAVAMYRSLVLGLVLQKNLVNAGHFFYNIRFYLIIR